jgi:5-formaminoimidazole-4-carboxamide-1-(beta)-D-ribofuranosyl 5'-monophosphate synthetase
VDCFCPGREIVEEYDADRVSIAVLASHSALQILHGAKAEGLRTVLVSTLDRLGLYSEYSHLIDHIVVVASWRETCSRSVVSLLRRLNSILVPHGSFVEYVGPDCAESIEVPIFGLRSIVRVESSQREKMKLLREAGIPVPREYSLEDEFEGPVIVKLPGAKGGRGYFLAMSSAEVREQLSRLAREGLLRDPADAIIQEYVVGVPAYYHYYQSPLENKLMLTGADVRYETTVDGLRRLPPDIASRYKPTYVVTGNIPLVLRESLLTKVLDYGRRFVKATRRLLPPGIFGPFSLESIVKDSLDIIVFEFSGRIVAGTNIYIGGSPYTALYGEGLSVGRLIARDVKLAAERGKLKEVVT